MNLLLKLFNEWGTRNRFWLLLLAVLFTAVIAIFGLLSQNEGGAVLYKAF